MNDKTIKAKGYQLVFNQDFEEKELDLKAWIPFYLPHWSSREKTKPRFTLENGKLILKIDYDQAPWSEEFNGPIRVSSLQTGVFSGPLGTSIGQHRIHPKAMVREEQIPAHTFLPRYGYFEIRAKASANPDNVSALWMIGYEDRPEHSAELCLVEIKGSNVEGNKAVIGYGIRKFQDPELQDAFFEETFELDVTEFHTYGMEWTQEEVSFYIDGKQIRTIGQSPQYPMQLMLNIYEIPQENSDRKPENYPQKFTVDYVKVFQKQELSN
ncbi:glycoside hydrolase family 16 protein [Algoriphagus confluentis]|uniref:GH16 domain-containing protein n=1 Tax=Algoriphagus confluentis TaxID=1697556 RepID=A0ABQ6PW55_9BACT|nr:hypothetical protein Aconfl_41750 [Algoriphagus confluentis]